MGAAAVLLLLASLQAPAASPQPVSTYSIVARDPETGRLGVAVQSHWFSVGSVVPHARPGVGAVATQSFARIAYGPELLEDLAAGLAPAEALAARLAADPGAAVRQVAVVDTRGRVAAHTGEACIPAAGHLKGEGWSVQANLMQDEGVVPAMAAAFESARGSFEERLLRALEAAEDAGGDVRGRQSAALLVVEGEAAAPGEGVVVDLRVEDHPDPLGELRRLWRLHRAYTEAAAGDEALARGQTETARSHYEEAASLAPESTELLYWRALALLQAGEEEPALLLFRRVFAREPRWLALAPRLVESGHLQAGAGLLARIAAQAPAFDLRRQLEQISPERLEADLRRLAAFGTRHTLSATDSPTRGIGAARRWLRDSLQRISEEYHEGRLQVSMPAFPLPRRGWTPQGGEFRNVLAILPGADPSRLVVVSGHYDSRASEVLDAESDAPGANDDASGTAAVLELARVLGGIEPRASIAFLAVAGEEQGLYGSRAQARAWTEQGLEVEAFLTLDIVGGATGSDGRREPWRLRVFSEGLPSDGSRVVGSDNDAPSRQLARYLRRAGEAAVPGFEITLILRQDRYLRGGDHQPFNELGKAAVRLTEPHENFQWQHQDLREEGGVLYGDRPENVDSAYLARVTAAAGAALAELALAPRPPAKVMLDVSELSPDTRLVWDPPQEGDPVDGYAVLLRRTHEPDWTERRLVGRVQEVLLEGVSKDDWLFAVEAVHADGWRSLPVYPRPVSRRR